VDVKNHLASSLAGKLQEQRRRRRELFPRILRETDAPNVHECPRAWIFVGEIALASTVLKEYLAK
jgi:hypothetical protein